MAHGPWPSPPAQPRVLVCAGPRASHRTLPPFALSPGPTGRYTFLPLLVPNTAAQETGNQEWGQRGQTLPLSGLS